ncbi:DUF885 domain-containing protein [Phytomonospora endophytica]|uniref:Uncharacterized protein (DUF885 family) n=1 Tax=Phytomonospora endophytica TaxID=714109 RepID=A0A841FTB5_9ACTN|nr:DUF885 domain-containing protein [Phytomonospora endophytica]MBB6035220.1 uncharacterized protein (DUF885 family) [Phytomonospora endophytica]GIG64031.1 hypothetical protein Pen01_03260 [Phytomonospora endophytica]
MRRIDEIADKYVEDSIALSPISATYQGVAGHDHELDDFSPSGLATEADLTRKALADLEAATPVDEREQVAKEGMVERLALSLERFDAGDTAADLNVIASPLQSVRQIFDLMTIGTEEQAANIAARLAKIPKALDGYRETLRAAAADGRVAAIRQVRECADQCDNWNGASGDDFWAGLVGRVTVDGSAPTGALATDLAAGAEAARRGVAEFGGFLRDELAPLAPENDAAGAERYARASRYFLGAAVDLQETYAWGWQELHRIESEMRRVSGEIVPGGSVDDAVAALDADPARHIATKAEFRDWMQELADRTIADLAGTHFDIPEPIRRIECCIAPTADGAIYYTGPSEDFTRPGRMWWSVPNEDEGFSTWREVTTVYHEGVPGHHLQVGQTAYRAELLNRYQRLMLWCSGHGEGWALYSERLMDELGYFDDPGAKLGMLDGQAFRAARVIVDIGMHLELEIPKDNPFGFNPGARWTAGLGWDFMRAHCRIDDAMLRFELSRYLGWPGQAPSYKVGERIWLQAREDAKARKGAAFDLKQFHTDALNLGALGLDPFRKAMERI